MAGITDFLVPPGDFTPEQKQWMQSQQLIGIGSRLLAAGAPSTDPRHGSIAYALSQGMAGMPQDQQRIMQSMMSQQKMRMAQGKAGKEAAMQKSIASIPQPGEPIAGPTMTGAPMEPLTSADYLGRIRDEYLAKGRIDEASKLQGMISKEEGAEGFSFTATARANEIAQAEYGRLYNQLTQEESAKVMKKVAAFEGLKSGARTKASGEAKKDLGLSAGDLQKFVDPNTLHKFPAGTTYRQVASVGGFSATPKQLESITELDNTSAIVTELDKLTERIILAEDAVAANIQGPELFLGAKSKSNPIAATYNDKRAAFTGVLSRSIGGEKGVLTDRDISRVVRSLPKFNDTKQIRDFKMATLKNLVSTAVDAKKRAITGRALNKTAINAELKRLIDALEGKDSRPPLESFGR
jgi:hypothetical protein